MKIRILVVWQFLIFETWKFRELYERLLIQLKNTWKVNKIKLTFWMIIYLHLKILRICFFDLFTNRAFLELLPIDLPRIKDNVHWNRPIVELSKEKAEWKTNVSPFPFESARRRRFQPAISDKRGNAIATLETVGNGTFHEFSQAIDRFYNT